MSKRLLIIDTGSNALDFAMRSMAHGWDIVYYDKPHPDGSVRQAGKGIPGISRLVDYNLLRTRYIDWADLIFLPDNNFYIDVLEPWRLKGYPIFGPSYEAAEWELDRTLGQEVMKKAGLNTIPGVEFHDYDAAASYVQKHPTYLVSKPSGDADKAMSYVAHDAAELVHMMLDRWKKNEKYVRDARKHGFILQEKVHGVEMAIGGWFGPGGWSKWWYENFEMKKLCNGDLGPSTGEQGTVAMYVKKSKLAEVAMLPITKQLKAIDYVGYCDLNGMIQEDGEFRPFEFTMRPPWPGFHNLIRMTKGDPAQWMLDLLLGRDTLDVIDDTVCLSVVMAIPDYPYSHLTNREVTGIPIYHAHDPENIHLCEVMMAENVPVQIGDAVIRMPHYVTTGDYVLVATGLGATITGARRSVYSTLKKIKMPGSPFYRTDIGVGRMVKGLPEVQKHGFATKFSFV